MIFILLPEKTNVCTKSCKSAGVDESLGDISFSLLLTGLFSLFLCLLINFDMDVYVVFS